MDILSQLEGFEAPAAAWESELDSWSSGEGGGAERMTPREALRALESQWGGTAQLRLEKRYAAYAADRGENQCRLRSARSFQSRFSFSTLSGVA